MSDDDRDPTSRQPAAQAAFERRAAALRANLKRRKAQIRGRAADETVALPKPGPSDDASD